MPSFRYSAIDKTGQAVSGRLDAADLDAATARMRMQGYWPTNIVEARTAHVGSRRSPTAPPQDVALLARELATLLRAGAPLDQALATLEEIAESRPLRRLIRTAAHRVRGGAPLASAFDQPDPTLDRGALGMIAAGEASGALPEVLVALAETHERIATTRAAVRDALVYPATVMVAAVGALVFMLVVVLPRFETVFASAGAEPPPQAAFVMAVSGALIDHGPTALLATSALLVAALVWSRTEAGALALSAAALRTPLAGRVLRDLETARFCRTFALMVDSGAPTLEAISAAVRAMSSSAMRRRCAGLAELVGSGAPLSSAMRRCGAFSPLASSLGVVGEESGAATTMLAHAADLLEAQARRRAKQAADLIAPTATLATGALAATVVVSVMSALLSVNALV